MTSSSTNPVVDAVAEREAELIDRLTVRANILHASAAWGSDADALLMQRAAKALARHRQSADAALVEALEKCLTQFIFMAKLASGGRVYEIEKATGKRVRRPLGEVISSECEVAATYVRAAIAKATGQ